MAHDLQIRLFKVNQIFEQLFGSSVDIMLIFIFVRLPLYTSLHIFQMRVSNILTMPWADRF
jgi:hypothetical protein